MARLVEPSTNLSYSFDTIRKYRVLDVAYHGMSTQATNSSQRKTKMHIITEWRSSRVDEGLVGDATRRSVDVIDPVPLLLQRPNPKSGRLPDLLTHCHNRLIQSLLLQCQC